MAKIHYQQDADRSVLDGQTVAVVGYGNQGRSWALNLRDSGVDVSVCVRSDDTRVKAEEDGFQTHDLDFASTADILCILIPDDIIPSLPITPKADALTIVASGYTVAFDRFDPAGDIGMIAPRMLGPEVRLCYEEGIGFITAIGVERDVTGSAWARLLAVCDAIGGLQQGAIELSAQQEAVLDLSVEQALSPALVAVNQAFVQSMLAQGIPIEAIVVEMVLSGEVERTYRLLREVGSHVQAEFHSPTSQYGQLSRREAYMHLDIAATMSALVEDIRSGKFADEWDAERDSGYALLNELKAKHHGPEAIAFDEDLRSKIGPGAAGRTQ